tara:strand:- start:249 stop:500 length:252 start_codon:yes stop_codon:yes gene_type:complete
MVGRGPGIVGREREKRRKKRKREKEEEEEERKGGGEETRRQGLYKTQERCQRNEPQIIHIILALLTYVEIDPIIVFVSKKICI